MNLAYIQQLKRLNPRQTRWSLFFAHFIFVLSYRLGTKNLKLDALLRHWNPATQELTHLLIIPSPK